MQDAAAADRKKLFFLENEKKEPAIAPPAARRGKVFFFFFSLSSVLIAFAMEERREENFVHCMHAKWKFRFSSIALLFRSQQVCFQNGAVKKRKKGKLHMWHGTFAKVKMHFVWVLGFSLCLNCPFS